MAIKVGSELKILTTRQTVDGSDAMHWFNKGDKVRVVMIATDGIVTAEGEEGTWDLDPKDYVEI